MTYTPLKFRLFFGYTNCPDLIITQYIEVSAHKYVQLCINFKKLNF